MIKNNYQEKWESRSSIRTRPRKYIDFNLAGDFFPQNKQVLFLLPCANEFTDEVRHEILVHSLYKHLNGIIKLESKLIISACNKIIDADLVIQYDETFKLNSHTIIIDEYYHIYVAKDMIQQLKNQYKDIVEFDEYPESDAANAINVIKSRLDIKYHDVFEIIAVCIFETTLVRELVETFNSPDIHPSIRYYIHDHMNDEARHYGFFYDLLCYTWDNLTPEYKKNIGAQLADFVKLYLSITSEKKFNLMLLSKILGNHVESQNYVNNLYHGFDITPEIPIIKNVLNVFKKSGLLDSEYVNNGFKVNELYI